MVTRLFHHIVNKSISNAPLIIFRVFFGLLMVISIIRFAAKGWIREYYIEPKFHFTYIGFEWVQPLPSYGMYLIFFIMCLASLGIALGFFYRIAVVVFFFCFTYIELLDKTFYLNHYYFISLASFLMIWLPAHKRFSLDVVRKHHIATTVTPAIHVNIIRAQIGIVYLYAGMAKLNTEWLLKAMPLKLWLPAHAHLPVIGPLFKKAWTAYVFSWIGAVYDILIPFLFFIRSIRWPAFMAVIFFHGLTALLFPIGVFPFIMIFGALLLFPADDQEKWLAKIENAFDMGVDKHISTSTLKVHPGKRILLFTYLLLQLIIPWRYLLYPGNLFWNEEGFRFSWRVMLMEKAGIVTFKITERESGRHITILNHAYLTDQQERIMSTQPDMILQYAHYLKEEWKTKMKDPIVTVDSFVTLNGNMSRRFIEEGVDLGKEKISIAHKNWIIEYEDI